MSKVFSLEVNGKAATATTSSKTVVSTKDSDGNDAAAQKSRTRAPTPGKTGDANGGSNFVRNSLPSRSVNFGHSRPTSAYLDRIRASVTASTTTNTMSSFNEQQTRNVLLTSAHQQQQQQHKLGPQQMNGNGNKSATEPRFWLNCMLEHEHTRKCFVDISSSAGHRVPLMQSQVVANDYTSLHVNGLPPASRQLNALIDPVSQERLMMSMMQHQHQQHGLPLGDHNQHPATGMAHRQSFPMVPEGTKLTEQQLAHLASLHHQHYYHHLQHMHQLHQLHHLHLQHQHQLHQQQQQQHKCQQQPPKAAATSPSTSSQSTGGHSAMDCEQLAACQRNQHQSSFGSSQFQAPADAKQFEQMYANMTNANSSTSRNAVNQQRVLQQQVGSPMMKNSPPTRVSPSRGPQSFNHNPSLPQIDEINGLPQVNVAINQHNHHQRKLPTNGHSPQTISTTKSNSSSPTKQQHQLSHQHQSNGSSEQQHHSTSSRGSPTSDATTTTPSSPTSSGSSNLSPSSASSSSSLNSLSANVPMNRSATLRHTTTNISRRQFSVEKELITNVPMTATLSRVGSCRASRSTDDARLSTHEFNRHLTAVSGNDLGVMREPLASQQPSMRTSKILNISGQQQQQTSQVAPSSIRISTNSNSSRVGATSSQQQQQQEQRVNKLTCNLANIKLNDRLAFSSLRVPKGTQGNILGRISSQVSSSTATNGHQKGTSKETPAGVEKRAKSNGGGNSAVWFEYGCV